MAAMYFSPDKSASMEEAVEGLYATAQQIDPGISLETVEEFYPGSGTIEASASLDTLDALKRGADERGIPVKAERLEYEPEEAAAVEKICDDLYFQ